MESKLIEIQKKSITETLDSNLESLILVGSFARGEGIESVSDTEFLAVVKDLSSAKIPNTPYDKLTIGFTTRKHLTKLKPYIFTIETKKFGKVLWGNKSVLDCIPEYSYEDIARADGFILLNNRIIEQLIIWLKIKSGESVTDYDLLKGYIQIANSLLAFHRCYRGLYPEKETSIKNLFTEQIKFKTLFPGLLTKINEVFTFLRNGVPGKTITGKSALKEWLEIRSHIKAVWSYEQKLLSYPSFSDKLHDYSRAIIKKGSPRFQIYQDAVKEYFSDTPDDTKITKVIAKWEKFVK